MRWPRVGVVSPKGCFQVPVFVGCFLGDKEVLQRNMGSAKIKPSVWGQLAAVKAVASHYMLRYYCVERFYILNELVAILLASGSVIDPLGRGVSLVSTPDFAE